MRVSASEEIGNIAHAIQLKVILIFVIANTGSMKLSYLGTVYTIKHELNTASLITV